MKDKEMNNIKETNRFSLFKRILKTKNYDSLYTMFGKDIYMLFTPFSHKAKDIKKLMEERNYALIYNKYGKFETFWIKKYGKLNYEFIKKLVKEERFYELYELYGDDIFLENESRIKDKDIYYETGSKFKVKLYKTKEKIAKGLKDALLISSSLLITGLYIGGELYIAGDKLYQKNLEENKELIEIYDNRVADYANYINELELENDLDVVMKVMYDMWESMGGYGEPKLDITGLGRLEFMEDNGVGVCRHIADDFSARMNAINPEYNARNVVVYFEHDSYTIDSFSNIEVKVVDSTEEESEEEVFENPQMLDTTKYLGNHMVTMFEPIGKDYTLIVDPTNPSIGIIVNGEIYMFSTDNGEGLSFKNLGHLICEWNYKYSTVAPTFFESFIDRTTEEELLNLKEEWGLDAQNESLEKVMNLDNNKVK